MSYEHQWSHLLFHEARAQPKLPLSTSRVESEMYASTEVRTATIMDDGKIKYIYIYVN